MGGIGGIVALALGATIWLGFSVATENTRILLRERATTFIDNISDEVRRHMIPAARNSAFTARHYAGLARMPNSDDAAYLSTAMALHPQLRFSGFFTPKGESFIYERDGKSRVGTWRGDPDIERQVAFMEEHQGTYWSGPVYSSPLKTTIVPITVPVRRDGAYLGFAGTAVSISELSRFVASLEVPGGSAFILLGKRYVIAHPLLIDGFLDGLVSHRTPLLNIVQTNDLVLRAFHDGAGEDAHILKDTDTDLKGRVFNVKGEQYALLYREMNEFGETPWLVGAYLKTSETGAEEVMRRLMLSMLAAYPFGSGISRCGAWV